MAGCLETIRLKPGEVVNIGHDVKHRFTCVAFVGGFGVKHDETYRPNDAEAFEFAPGAQRFEVDSVYRPGIYGLRPRSNGEARSARAPSPPSQSLPGTA